MTKEEVTPHLDKAKELLLEVAKEVNIAISKMEEVDSAQKHMFAAAAFVSAISLELKMYIAMDMENYFNKEEMEKQAEDLVKLITKQKDDLEKRSLSYFS